jgi:dihydropyrimidine dehydrogenase (NAD+) subunit PreA
MTVSIEVEFASLRFKNPFILASAPPTGTRDMIERAFELGWAGAVTKTLAYDPRHTSNVQPRIRAIRQRKDIIAFSNIELGSPRPLSAWIDDISWIKKKYPDHILFASLLHADGLVEDQWREVAMRCEQAGADGLELNFSCSHGMAEGSGGAAIACRVDVIGEVLHWIKQSANIPVMVKLPAIVENLPDKALAAKKSGADAIAAINTISSLSGIDIRTFVPFPQVDGKSAYSGLSGAAIKPVGLRCVAQIAGAVDVPVSGMGGIATWQDAVEYMLAGAATVQICSAVMHHGYGIIHELKKGLTGYMAEMGFSTVRDFIGKALPNIRKHNELSRAYRVLARVDEKACTGCGLCAIACQDSGYQAILMSDRKKPIIDKEKCDGCGLCSQVCPVANCISMERKY